jgi:hypothetical protein
LLASHADFREEVPVANKKTWGEPGQPVEGGEVPENEMPERHVPDRKRRKSRREIRRGRKKMSTM